MRLVKLFHTRIGLVEFRLGNFERKLYINGCDVYSDEGGQKTECLLAIAILVLAFYFFSERGHKGNLHVSNMRVLMTQEIMRSKGS